MATILFYPAFPDRASLYDQLFRAVWHFSPMVERITQLVFPYGGDDKALIDVDQSLSRAKLFLSKDFDPHIAEIAPEYQARVTISDPHERLDDLSDVKGILVWDSSDPATMRNAQTMAKSYGAEVVHVDPKRAQQETLNVIRFAYTLWTAEELSGLVENSYSIFRTYYDGWKGKAVSAFGNGPSLGRVIQEQARVEDSLRAVCNSTIGDQAALDYLQPELLFCGDPVQHCGVSMYAGAFRRDLAKAMETPNRVLFTQLGYVPYFRSVTPEAAHNRIIGVGNDRRAVFNLDLTAEFLTAASANIFTMLVLPVAFTLSDQVDIYGCDGMAFGSATKPWSHSNEDDYMGKMSVTHRVHSGFWDRNYEEEYWSYTRDLGDLIDLAEKGGRTVCVRTPSYVAALAKRHKAT